MSSFVRRWYASLRVAVDRGPRRDELPADCQRTLARSQEAVSWTRMRLR